MEKMFESYPDCVTVSQLQEMLNIGKNYAYDLLVAGKIKHTRIGKKYIIPKPCVIDFLVKEAV